MKKERKGILIILDGYGEGESGKYNAVENSNTPFLKYIKTHKPNCLLRTDSKYVGLPDGTMGGSEVGHMTIGAGKVKRSMQVKIDEEIDDGSFYKEPALSLAFEKLKKNNGALHLAGLWSDKQIHSNINHCFALMRMAKEYDIKSVFVHCFTDGRDCAPKSCKEYFEKFQKVKNNLGLGEIATIGGRFYAMDRENNLDRTGLAIDKMMQKDFDVSSVDELIELNYSQNITDEFFVPKRIKTEDEYNLTENDLLIFFNTRADRMKQPVKMASEKLPCSVLTFCNFIDSEKVPYVFEEDFVKDTMCEYLSKLGKKQLKISESTKYAHVTYFFNGGEEKPFNGEDRIHVPTEKTDDYSKTPLMKAKEITEETVKALKSDVYDDIVVNFSNPDMIGHTGNYDAVVVALEFLDKCVKTIVDVATACGYFVMICADHGNAEEMKSENGEPQTAHTLNPVKCVVIDKENENIKLRDGGLKDVAPTFIKLMNIKQNPAFEGSPLF